VIDEIHAFFDNARGIQLRSLLSRLAQFTNTQPRIIGLSATLDNFDLVKNWVNFAHPDNVEIIEVKGSDKQLLFYLMHIPSEASQLPLELFEDIRVSYVNEDAAIALNDIRRKFHLNSVTSDQRVIWLEKDEGIFDTYTGTTISRTLVWMLRYFGVDAKVKDGAGRIKITYPVGIPNILQKMKEKKWTPEDLLPHVLEHEFFMSKYTEHISKPLHIKMHIANEFNIEETVEYLKQYHFKGIVVG
jgi:hypothetical protein